MRSKKKSRQEHDLESPEYNERSRNRKRTHSSSSDNGMNKYRAGKRKEEYDGKRHNDRDHNRSRKQRSIRDKSLDEGRGRREKKIGKREEGEETKEFSRKSCHKNESTYSKRKDDKDKYEKNLNYQSEKFSECDRYWGKNDSEFHTEKQSNNRYWSKYPVSEKTKSVQARYYGDSSRDSQSQRTEYKSLENKENQRLRDGKRRRDEDISTSKEKKVENDDSVQNSDTSTKHDSKKDKVVNSSSTQQSDAASVQKKTVDLLTSRAGGAYIPPAKLRMMQAQITDKSSAAYQRIAWEALKKSIHGHINKVNTGNIAIIVRELLRENIVRGRGLLCRSIIQAQAASPTFTHVYAALVAVINSKVRSEQHFLCAV
jgi:pre-mRNA-splicing factor CWC22